MSILHYQKGLVAKSILQQYWRFLIKQKEMDDKDQFPIQELTDKLSVQIPVKNLYRLVLYASIVSISVLYFGYSLTLIASSSLPMLISYYKISVSKTVCVALLNGALPVGGIFGSLLVPFITPLTSKRRIHYFLTIATVIVCGISVIPNFVAVMIGRFLLGALVSHYLSVSAGYIKQTFPDYSRKPLGAIYSCGRVIGILACFVIAYIAGYAQNQIEHIFVFFGPAYFSVLQSILVWKILPESPTQMIKNNNYQQAKRTLDLMYSRDNIDKRLEQIQNRLKQNDRQTIRYKQLKFTNPKNIISLHLAVLRHFCGMSYIVIYANQVVAAFDVADSKITPVIINSVQLAANIVGIFLVQKRSRTSMLTISCWLMGVINLVIGVADIEEEPIFTIVMMAIFMIPCGGGLNSIVYTYPSQLVVPNLGKYTSAVSWLASAIVSVVPPFVTAAIPSRQAYPMFFFFAFYLSIVTFINIKLLPSAQVVSKRKVFALKEMKEGLM